MPIIKADAGTIAWFLNSEELKKISFPEEDAFEFLWAKRGEDGLFWRRRVIGWNISEDSGIGGHCNPVFACSGLSDENPFIVEFADGSAVTSIGTNHNSVKDAFIEELRETL